MLYRETPFSASSATDLLLAGLFWSRVLDIARLVEGRPPKTIRVGALRDFLTAPGTADIIELMNPPSRRYRFARAVAAASLVALAAGSTLAADDARQIVEEAQRRTEADSQSYDGLLEVIDAKGRIAPKRWTFRRLGSHGESKAVLRFTEPPEVRGVALLIVNHPDRASDQWMWTPAIQRVRRIALQDRSTRFFGTDFSFEDLEERDVDQYDYSLEGEDVVEGASCWKIRSTPRETRSSQYTHSFLWIRKDSYAIVRIENYAEDRLIRRVNYSDFRKVGGIWTARAIEVADLTRDSRTRLTLEELEYDVPLSQADFTQQALRR